MAQVGRISGPLLEANLLRQGIANGTQQNLSFKNTDGATSLLKIDVANGRIGVDLEAPANQLQISQTTQTTDLIVTNCADIANFNICNTDINVNSGILYLNAAEAIVLSNLETEQFYISDNYILTNNTNTNLELRPNGVGTVEVQSNLTVLADLHATGNITLDGNITFGDTLSQDTVDFNADINTDIVPDIDATYDLGNVSKRWNKIYTNFVYGQLVASGAINVDGMRLDSRQGGIFYVAKGGSNTNVGDHPQGPLLTIEEAISRCDASTTGPVTIYVYPGIYEEVCPLVIPNNVTIVGVDLRNVVVKPTVATQSEDIFHLSDSSTVSNITIKDYYYDSGNNTGYAFRFAPGAVITNRSPYIQNVTVITAGSITSAGDPRGFDEGDAGRGAWIDGAELDSASIEASMLFHSATFITPGADTISMTNGVRVEWLNSFTYFANRGLYAFNGVTGRTTYDGSTVEYGAEVRSIGSANVYGNYGAVADGADTLMYLIQHNMAYIGAGKFVDNDASRAVYANETVELNSGKIHYTTTDHLGGFRIGDNFWVDFETGNTTINIDTLTVNQFNALRVNTGANTTVIDGSFIETGNFTISSNVIETNSGDINIAASTGTINLQDNTNITGNLSISGDLSYDGVLNISGDEATDSLTFNVEFEQNFNPNLHQTYDLGSFEKKWLIAHLDRVEAGDMSFYDNIVTTNVSNADLELRASGTGNIYIPANATISNALTVDGTTTINDSVNIVDNTFTLTGNITQTGSTTTSENFNVGENIDVSASAQFEEILVDDNFITTTTTNADLELRASGTGIVNLQTNVNVDNNLSANDVGATNVTVTLNTTSDNANIGNVEINDNYIETTSIDGDLTLVSTRNVIVTGTDVRIVNGLTVSTDTDLQGTSITGLLLHTGNTDQTGNVTLNGELTVDNVYVEDNFITTTTGSLTLGADRNVIVPANDVTINQNLTVSTDTSLQDTTITGTLAHTGAYNQTGNYTIGGELTVDNIYVEDNFITTTTGNLVLEASGTGTIFASSNDVVIDNDLAVDGVTDLDDTTINGTLSHTGNRTQTGNYDIAGELTVDNVYVEDNFITTTTGNLILGATGDINVDTNDVEIAQNLTVSGITSLQGTSITGTVTQVGDRNQTGNYTIAGEISNGNILIEDNFITTTNSNSDLELRASGTGEVVIDSDDTVTINNNLFVGGTLTYQGFLTINGNVTLQGNTQDGSLTVTNNFDVTGTLDISSQAQFEDVRIEDNFITTTLSNSNLELRASGTGNVLISNNNVQVNNNLFTASISTGDITVNNDLVLDELVITDSNIEINENYISTKISNADLELRATGNVVAQENTVIEQNLTINGSTSLQNTTVIDDLTQTGNLDQTGNYNLTGNLNLSSLVIDSTFQFDDVRISGNVLETTLSNSNLELRAAGTGEILLQENVYVGGDLSVLSFNVDSITVANSVDLEIVELSTDIQFEDNVITTTNSNSNLELRAAGTGNVYLQQLGFNNDTISTISTNIIIAPTENLIIDATAAFQIPAGTTAQRIVAEDFFLDGGAALNSGSILDGGDATTIFGSTDVIYNSGAALLSTIGELGDIRFNTSDNVFEGTSSSTLTFGGVYSSDRLTSVTVDPISNNIRFIVSGVASPLDSSNLVGEVTGEGLFIHAIQVEDINLNNNVIKTTNSNSDLELRANGTGELVVDDLSIKDNIIKDSGNNLILKNTGFGRTKFNGTFGVVIPAGATVVPSPAPQVGDTRWNTDTELLETWDGTQYITSAGVASAISAAEFDDLLLEYTLIFG